MNNDSIIQYSKKYLKIFDTISKTVSIDQMLEKRLLIIAPPILEIIYSFNNRRYCMQFINNLFHAYQLTGEIEQFTENVLKTLIRFKTKIDDNLINSYISEQDPTIIKRIGSLSRLMINPRNLKKLYLILKQLSQTKETSALNQLKKFVRTDVDVPEEKIEVASVDRSRLMALIMLFFIHRFFPGKFQTGLTFVRRFLNMIVKANQIQDVDELDKLDTESDDDELDSDDETNVEIKSSVSTESDRPGMFNGYRVPVIRKPNTIMITVPIEFVDKKRSGNDLVSRNIGEFEGDESELDSDKFMRYLSELGIKPTKFYFYNIELRPVNGKYVITRAEYDLNQKRLAKGGPQVLQASKDEIEKIFNIEL